MAEITDDKHNIVTEAPPYDHAVVPSTFIKPQARKLHDKDVKLEEYLYYANQTREYEKGLEKPKLLAREIIHRRKPAHQVTNGDDSGEQTTLEAKDFHEDVNFSSPEARLAVSDDEWAAASRAFRTASTGAAFYLITTDILGPYGVGFAMGTLGWGPGIALYTVFGLMAGYSGYLIWHVFCGVDSYQFPCRNYGDLAFRSCGWIARHITNFIQALALFLLLGQVTIQSGQSISQVSKFRLCYIVCPLLFVICGFLLTQIRTLKSFGLVANFAVWLNLLAIFMTMGFFSHSPPNYAVAVLGSAGSAVDPATITADANGNYPPIIHYNGLPTNNLVGSINGLLSGVLAYAGAQLFCEFMAEMRRPMDFLKAMWGAQFFIYTVYIVYGCFIYYYQGQYSYQPSFQGLSIYGWQTAANMITLVASLIAAALYGNIGIKVFYNNVLVEWFTAPAMSTKRGKFLYGAIVPVWWSLAFIVAAAIPDYFGFVAVISASTLLNLTYTLPPLFALGFDVQKMAIRADQGEGFDPHSGIVTRNDKGLKRYLRAFFTGGPVQVGQNIWHVIYFLASLSMSGLGMYAAVEGMIEVFADNAALSSFSCVSPLNLAAQQG